MAIERIWDIQGFSGGESDDIFKGPKDCFFAGENIEVRKNMSGVQLSSAMIDTGWSISGTICYMENLERFGLSGVVVCTDSGNIYLNGVLKTTINTGIAHWNTIIGIGTIVVSGTQYLYYITRTAGGAGKIHRSTTNLGTFDISTSGGAWDKSFTTASSGTSSFCGTIMSGGNMYFAINNCVFMVDSIEVINELITLPSIEGIRGFTQFQNSYKIYSSYGNTGVQYASWDGTTTQPEYRQEWENQPVLSIVNNGAYDYAILGYNQFYSDLYLISGTQKQELRVNLENSNYSRTLEGYMSIRENIIYISGGNTGGSAKHGVYTFGNYYPGNEKSLVQQYSLPNSAKAKFTVHSTAISYISTTDSKIYTVTHNNPPTAYATTGYLVTNQWEGVSWEEKTFKKTKISFKLETGSSFKIYIRKEYTDNWQLAKTFDYSTYSGKRSGTIFENEIKSLGLGNFNSLQIKLELYGTTTFTPVIKRVTTYMDVVNNN